MKRVLSIFVCALAALACLAAPSAFAAQPAVGLAPVRLALVIGTSDYPGDFRLPNPEKDAQAIALALAKGGFQTPASVVPGGHGVTALINPNRSQMVRAILSLKAEAEKARQEDRDVTVLFYFAGHGVQFNGINYLIPAGTGLFNAAADAQPTEADYKTETVTAQEQVLDELTDTGATRVIVVLDACRTNPFDLKKRGLRTADGGLAAMRPPTGAAAMIFYASEPRRPAIDAVAGAANSPFTGALDAFLDIPGLKAGEVFARVHDRVSVVTRGEQNPYFEGAPLFDFEFNPARAAAALPAGEPTTPSAAPGAPPIAAVATPKGDYNPNADARVILQAALRKTPITELQTLAEGGEAFSQWLLGLAYMDGVGVQKDPKKARDWVRSAVSKGLSRAIVTLGYMHQHGVGGEASASEAVGWYQIAAGLGEPAAKGALGWYYMTGSGGVTKDMAKARELFTEAAKDGHPYSQDMLKQYFP